MLFNSARRRPPGVCWRRHLAPLAPQQTCRQLSSGSAEVSTAVTEATQRWIDSMVVGLGLCPFTKPLRKRPHSLRTRHSFATNEEELVQCVDQELQLLQPGITGPGGFVKHPPSPTPETTLLVVAPWDGHYSGPGYYLRDFRAFLNAAWAVESRIDANGLGDHIQVLSLPPPPSPLSPSLSVSLSF